MISAIPLTSPQRRSRLATPSFRWKHCKVRLVKKAASMWSWSADRKPGLQKTFDQNLTLDDWGLSVRGPTAHEDFLTLESRQLLIEPAVESAALTAAKETALTPAPTLVYLADTVSDGKADVPYMVVAALDPAAPPPLGPFLPKGVSSLKDDEIVLAEWPGSPLTTTPGATVTLSYYPPEQHGEFKLDKATFKLAGVIPMTGPAADPGLTPELPGVTDKTNIRDWNPPFPFDDRRIKPRQRAILEGPPGDAAGLRQPGGRAKVMGQPLR